MKMTVITSLDEITAPDWNLLNRSGNPFLSHEFLYGLEIHRCLEPQGWHSSHLILRDDDDTLLGAMPLYLRTNSYGEFVFDWAWADAFERAGGRYYPKFVSAIPFTPASGDRLLISPEADESVAVPALLQGAIEVTSRRSLTPTLAKVSGSSTFSKALRRAMR